MVRSCRLAVSAGNERSASEVQYAGDFNAALLAGEDMHRITVMQDVDGPVISRCIASLRRWMDGGLHDLIWGQLENFWG